MVKNQALKDRSNPSRHKGHEIVFILALLILCVTGCFTIDSYFQYKKQVQVVERHRLQVNEVLNLYLGTLERALNIIEKHRR